MFLSFTASVSTHLYQVFSLSFASQIEKLCRKADNTVAVADPANRPAYMLYKHLLVVSPSLAAAAYLGLTRRNLSPIKIWGALMTNSITPYWYWIQKAATERGELHYDKNEIHGVYEKKNYPYLLSQSPCN